jgi:D-ribulokinase
MPDRALFLGIDLGTSGARAVVIDSAGEQVATARAAMSSFGANLRDPAVWWAATKAAVHEALAAVDRRAVRALAVDGTSGTMLAVGEAGEALGDGLMYNDACTEANILAAIARHAPTTSAAHGATSGAARAIILARRAPYKVLHQADWIAWHFSGQMVSDANNALKTGYDAVAANWPDWLADAGVDLQLLPSVLQAGDLIGRITRRAAQEFGLAADCAVVAGTTDGCASFLATGAQTLGEGVTALGTTLTVKLLCERPIFAPEFGIYSHSILGKWLAGGASNSGGAALLAHFSADQIAALSAQINPARQTGLDYYPLPSMGERFPIADPALAPRITPRPAQDADFLHGLLEGVANIEALAFARLRELGGPVLISLRSVGGGAANSTWSAMRARILNVPMRAPISDEAAYGAALLAQRGAR